MIRDVQAQGGVQDVVPGHEVQDNLEVSRRVYFFHNIGTFCLIFRAYSCG